MPIRTKAQRNTLRAFVAASSLPAIVDARASGNTADLAAALNAPDRTINASADTPCWSSSVPSLDLLEAMNIAQYAGLALQGQRDAWALMMQRGTIDATRAKTRAQILACWSGSNAAALASIANACTAPLTVAQAQLSLTDQSIGATTAKQSVIEGPLTADDAQQLIASPE